MGNAISCAPLIVPNGAVKVLFADGKLEIFTRPIKAAELMVDNPGQFVCDSGGLTVGHRIHGLCADDELRRRHFYFVLPMELLYSVLTEEEMATLDGNASKAVKQSKQNLFQVALGEFCLFPFEARKLDSSDMNDGSAEMSAIESPEKTKRCMSKQKSYSWRPALETIVETPCRLK